MPPNEPNPQQPTPRIASGPRSRHRTGCSYRDGEDYCNCSLTEPAPAEQRRDGWYWIQATAQNPKAEVAQKVTDHFHYRDCANSNPYRVISRIPSPQELADVRELYNAAGFITPEDALCWCSQAHESGRKINHSIACTRMRKAYDAVQLWLGSHFS